MHAVLLFIASKASFAYNPCSMWKPHQLGFIFTNSICHQDSSTSSQQSLLFALESTTDDDYFERANSGTTGEGDLDSLIDEFLDDSLSINNMEATRYTFFDPVEAEEKEEWEGEGGLAITPAQTIRSALQLLRGATKKIKIKQNRRRGKNNDKRRKNDDSVIASDFLSMYCLPLTRTERYSSSSTSTGTLGGEGSQQKSSSSSSNTENKFYSWKEIMRGSITPKMFLARIRSSDFSALLDWTNISVTEGLSISMGGTAMNEDEELLTGEEEEGDEEDDIDDDEQERDFSMRHKTYAYVNAAVFFEDGIEPLIIQFSLRKVMGRWLIDNALICKTEWFRSS